ncbi:arginyltransferase [Advenella mimigardefordensis]|uniref:Aspartate/glutamate leucyltransferase n=1 Tax=Advenella mimigardefordensis (strain DSM 17166 / LMG 22922 / DPN7) TaxID=1247726 RepID=W0P8T0_ADVMD|nr:arginyltransferase [Advenella mimigardefordensis]AHG63136.1 arginyl-tRNA--protein transferase [Advenella mimigardefordensis DPN7]
MSDIHDPSFNVLQFYLTAPYSCSYLDGKMARSQVVVPGHLIHPPVYAQLLRTGFRRSGLFTYRPRCDQCRACISVRINCAQFAPTRTQRRILKRHSNLRATIRALEWDQSHFDLYRKYQASRHAGGGMDDDSAEQYEEFLLTSRIDSQLVEFHDEQQVLRMISIIDVSDDGLSSVYTFYDPDYAGSLGTYGILWQIGHCNERGLPWLYLGYWIAQSRKMAYKINFRPIELYINHRWIDSADIDLSELSTF